MWAAGVSPGLAASSSLTPLCTHIHSLKWGHSNKGPVPQFTVITKWDCE